MKNYLKVMALEKNAGSHSTYKSKLIQCERFHGLCLDGYTHLKTLVRKVFLVKVVRTVV